MPEVSELSLDREPSFGIVPIPARGARGAAPADLRLDGLRLGALVLSGGLPPAHAGFPGALLTANLSSASRAFLESVSLHFQQEDLICRRS